jgi:hypothetical protein
MVLSPATDLLRVGYGHEGEKRVERTRGRQPLRQPKGVNSQDLKPEDSKIYSTNPDTYNHAIGFRCVASVL